MDGRKNNGGARPGAGRKPKADEQKLIEKLSIHDETAHEILVEQIKEREPWALKMFFEYRYGKPKQQIENKIEWKEQPLFPYVQTDDSDKKDTE